ncbi:AAA family ATPase [Pseudomonas sp. SWI44]|uniref:AAA family ATPase n=1 Tax=Pseudomonas sp. SWI44 TaxID=2083053 RepID=UPI0021145BB1|nr:AAA family ATPase [Pseudomonas sp. SWI44]
MHKATDHTSLWPTWIGEDTGCNVWIAGYGAATSKWVDTAMHLADQGVALVSALRAEESLNGARTVLVGHSLGGLVIKSGMTQAESLGDPSHAPVLNAIEGVVFLGTPHQGANLANLADVLRILVRPNPQVGNMQTDDAWLKTLNGQFRHLQARRKFQVSVFFETKKLFKGIRILGIPLGKSFIIVDRHSSDPGIEGVVPTGIEGDHLEIAKPRSRAVFAHKALVDIIKRIAQSGGLPPGQGLTPPLPNREPILPSAEEIARKLSNASIQMLNWPSTLADGTWLQRMELEPLSLDLNGEDEHTFFILGEPGSGKSSLLVKIAEEKRQTGWSVLAIKADRLPEEVRDRQGLNGYLDLGGDSVAILQAAAASGPVLVVIDQIDALAELMVQQSARLRVLLDFVNDLASIPGVRTVISCRTFEQKHDPALRNLSAQIVNLELPEWSAVLPVLQAQGLHADVWNPELKQILRSPHALVVYLSLLREHTELGALTSFHGLQEAQWEKYVLSDPTDTKRKTLRVLAKIMAEREVLGLPLAIVEEHYMAIKQLSAIGLLRIDAGRVEFRHQTLYEFVRARMFLEESGSLTDTVVQNQNTLRIRPQVWHALSYFRSAAPLDYEKELEKLWAAELRPHLRMLLIEFLGKQTALLSKERTLVETCIEDTWLFPRFISAMVGSPGWFDALTTSAIPKWMAQGEVRAQALVPLLNQALQFNASAVVSLIHRFWLPDPQLDSLSWQVLAWNDVSPTPGLWLDGLTTIASRSPLSEWAIASTTNLVSIDHPNEAPKLLGAWLNRAIEQAKSIEGPPSGTSTVEKMVDGIRNIIQNHHLHEIEAVAEAAPQRFCEEIWPLLVECFQVTSSRAPGSGGGYRDSQGLSIRHMGEGVSHCPPLLGSIFLALKEWATLDAVSFLDFADSYTSSESLLVHRLLSLGRAVAGRTWPTRILQYISDDPRRLMLGPYSDVHQDSIALIQTIAPRLDDQHYLRLEEMLKHWSMPVIGAISEPVSIRQRRTIWNRQHRLRLFRALPAQRLTPAIQKTIEEENRAFPSQNPREVTFGEPQWIGSPVTAEQMAKASDEDVFGIFAELTDECGWDHPRHQMQGGAIQAGRELGRLAHIDLPKTLRILRSLKPAVNEIPAACILRELTSAKFPAAELHALVLELAEKGFSSPGFRSDAALAIESSVTEDQSIPEALIAMLEKWLTAASSVHDPEPEDPPKPNRSSVLWGGGLSMVIPEGNYPVLSALTAACLVPSTKEIDRWLDILEKHAQRSEVPKVWEMLLQSELTNLGLCDHLRAESLVETVVSKLPTLLCTDGWIRFLAMTNRWASSATVQRWIELTVGPDRHRQGAGELIALRHARFPAERWSRDMAYALAEGDGEASVGLAHSVARLWAEPITRPAVQPLVVKIIARGEPEVLTALSAIFTGDAFLPDAETFEVLDAFVEHPHILHTGPADMLPEQLAKLVTREPRRIFLVANAMLDAAASKMGNIATSWYLSTEWIVDIALKLQDLDDSARSLGALLFERMLEFNIPQAREMSICLDKRTPASRAPQPQRRRPRSRGKQK